MKFGHPNSIFFVSAMLLTCVEIRNCSRIANCTESAKSCPEGCNEATSLPYSATFCDTSSGSCMCDCRDTPATTCIRDPDSDCNINCEKKNPNPEVFTYYGNFCPNGIGNETVVCACACFINPDYYETNEI